jgi:phosphate transport system substrate-binding protein
VDFVVLGGSLSPRERHAGLRQTRLGLELFAIAVSPDFPLRSLSRSQVRQLLAGEVTEWGQLGYDLGPVTAVVPAERALAERAAKALIPGDDFAAAAVRVASEALVAEQVQRHRGAIGVVRVPSRPQESGLRLLPIDWTPPTPEAFGYGTYPFGVPVHLITSGQPDGAAQRFLQFAQSVEGRTMLSRTLLVQ